MKRIAVTILIALSLAACSPYEAGSDYGGGVDSSTPSPRNDGRVQGCDGICGELVKLNDKEACYSTTGGAVSNDSFPPVCYELASNFTKQSGVAVGLNVKFILDSAGTKLVRLELAPD